MASATLCWTWQTGEDFKFPRAWKPGFFSLAFLAVPADAICHSTTKISVHCLQKWTSVSVFSLDWHCSVSFLSARLLNPVRFFAHYFIPLLPSDSLEWKLSSQLSPDEYGARLPPYCSRWSVPPSNVQQPYIAPRTAANHWSKVRQPKRSSVFGFCHLFWCFPSSVPSLGHRSV